MKVQQTNEDIRKEAKRQGVRFWEMAEHLGVSESTFSKVFRRELPDSEKEKYLALIKQIADEKASKNP